MRSSKGQGLSINFIVIAAIAALVLVLIISFVLGAGGSFLGKIFGSGEEATADSDLQLAKSRCNNLCAAAETLDDPTDWADATYCSQTFIFEEEMVNCWEEPVNVDCSLAVTDVYGTLETCSESNCQPSTCKSAACKGGEECTDLGYEACGAEESCAWAQ